MNVLMYCEESQINFVKTFAQNQVTVIVSGTGTGKTVTIPMLAHKATGGRVLCTQPRIANCIGAFEGARVVHNFRTGYKTALEEKNTFSKVLYVTDGMIATSGVWNCDVLIVDEVHERNTNMILILLQAKKRLEVDKSFKLVLMSATIDSFITELKSYFNGFTMGILNYEGITYEIEELHTPTLRTLTQFLFERKEDVMMFFSGKNTGLAWIRDNMYYEDQVRLWKECEVLSINSESDEETRHKLYKRGDKPRLWLATNAAQAGITPVGLKLVISMGTKFIIRENDKGIEELVTELNSIEDLTQQKGRVGRMEKGYWLNDLAGGRFPETTEPEMKRVLITQHVLALLSKGIDIRVEKLIDQPSEEKIERAIAELIELGAITEELDLTTLGYELVKIPLNPKMAKSIVIGSRHGVGASLLRINALLSSQNPFLKSNRTEMSNNGLVCFAWDMLQNLNGVKNMEGVNPTIYKRLMESIEILEKRANTFDRGATKEKVRKALMEAAGKNVWILTFESKTRKNTYENPFTGAIAYSWMNCKVLTAHVEGIKGTNFLKGESEITIEELKGLHPNHFSTEISIGLKNDYCDGKRVVETTINKFNDIVLDVTETLVEPTLDTTRQIMDSIPCYTSVYCAVEKIKDLLSEMNIESVDTEEIMLNEVICQYGFISARKHNLELNQNRIVKFASKGIFSTHYQMTEKYNTYFPKSIEGCKVKYSDVVTIEVPSHLIGTLDFNFIDFKGREVEYICDFKGITYCAKSVNELQNNSTLIDHINEVKTSIEKEKELDSLLRKNDYIWAHFEDECPKVKEIIGKYNIVYQYPTFSESRNNVGFALATTQCEERAWEEYNTSVMKFNAWKTETIERRIEERIENSSETTIVEFNDCNDIEIEETKIDGITVFKTYKVNIDHELNVHLTSIYSRKESDLIEIMERSNHLLTLVDDGFTPCIVTLGSSWYKTPFIVLDKVIYSDFIDDDKVKFIETSEREVTMYLKEISDVRVIYLNVKPDHKSIYDTKFDDMVKNVEELYSEYKSFYSRGSGENLYNKVINACSEKNWSMALENFNTLFDLIASKSDYINPYIKEKSFEESLASLMNKWGGR